MKQVTLNCKQCTRRFRSRFNYQKQRQCEFCSRGCATRYRHKIAPETFQKHRTNGHLKLDQALALIRQLKNAGFLSDANIKQALRRSSDR